MHKLILFTLLLIGNLLYAQVMPTDTNYYMPYEYDGPGDEMDASPHYIQIGVAGAMPVGQWGAAPSNNLPLLAAYVGEDGMGASWGYLLNFEQHIGLKYTTLNTFYPSIHWGMEYSFNGLPEWGEVVPGSYTSYGSGSLNIELGGAVAYNFNNYLIWELEGTLYFPLLGLADSPEIGYDPMVSTDNSFQIVMADNPDGNTRAYKPGVGLSTSIRYKSFKLFMEYFYMNTSRYYHFVTYDSNQEEIETPFTSNFDVSTVRIGLAYVITY